MEEKQTKTIRKRGTHRQRVAADINSRHMEQLTKKARALAGEDEPEDVTLEGVTKRLATLVEKQSQLQERLTSDSEKLATAHLRQEFEDAQADLTSAYELDENEWDDEFIRRLQKNIVKEAFSGHESLSRVLYKFVNKTFCGLKQHRIGIQYDTSFADFQRHYTPIWYNERCHAVRPDVPQESYYLVLAIQPYTGELSVTENTIPFFLPLQKSVETYFSSSVTRFIDHVGNLLQGFISRREQVLMFKERQGNKIKHMSNTLPCDRAEFFIEEQNCKLTVSLTYEELDSDQPTQVKVFAWPFKTPKDVSQVTSPKRSKPRANPYMLTFAEDCFKKRFLPDAYDDIIERLNTILEHNSIAVGTLAHPPEEK